MKICKKERIVINFWNQDNSSTIRMNKLVSKRSPFYLWSIWYFLKTSETSQNFIFYFTFFVVINQGNLDHIDLAPTCSEKYIHLLDFLLVFALDITVYYTFPSLISQKSFPLTKHFNPTEILQILMLLLGSKQWK